MQARHRPQSRSSGASGPSGMSVSTVTSRKREPSSGLTRRLFRPNQPRPAALATCLCERWARCPSQSTIWEAATGSDREAQLLDAVGDEERAPVEEIVDLPVMVEIDRGRTVEDVLEDPVAQLLSERYGEREPVPRGGLEQEIAPHRRDVRDAEQVEPEAQGEGLRLPIAIPPSGFSMTESIVSACAGGCQSLSRDTIFGSIPAFGSRLER